MSKAKKLRYVEPSRPSMTLTCGPPPGPAAQVLAVDSQGAPFGQALEMAVDGAGTLHDDERAAGAGGEVEGELQVAVIKVDVAVGLELGEGARRRAVEIDVKRRAGREVRRAGG